MAFVMATLSMRHYLRVSPADVEVICQRNNRHLEIHKRDGFT